MQRQRWIVVRRVSLLAAARQSQLARQPVSKQLTSLFAVATVVGRSRSGHARDCMSADGWRWLTRSRSLTSWRSGDVHAAARVRAPFHPYPARRILGQPARSILRRPRSSHSQPTRSRHPPHPARGFSRSRLEASRGCARPPRCGAFLVRQTHSHTLTVSLSPRRNQAKSTAIESASGRSGPKESDRERWSRLSGGERTARSGEYGERGGTRDRGRPCRRRLCGHRSGHRRGEMSQDEDLPCERRTQARGRDRCSRG